MKEFWNTLQLVFAAVGGWLGYFLGGCDGLLYALLIFVICDYITGVMGAINDKKLSSAVGFRGICRKVLIFILVGIANVIDINVLGQVGVLRTAVIFFYISNEGLSLIENAAHLTITISLSREAMQSNTRMPGAPPSFRLFLFNAEQLLLSRLNADAGKCLCFSFSCMISRR